MKLSMVQKGTKNAQRMIRIYENCLLHLKVYGGSCKKMISMIYLNLGIVYESRNKFEKALICYEKCSEIKAQDNSSTKVQALIRRVTLLLCCERDEEAKAVLQLVCEEGEIHQRAEILMLEGQLYERSSQVREALERYTLALSMAATQNKQTVARCKAEIANLLFGLEKYQDAKLHVDDALKSSDGMVKAKLLLLRGQICQSEKNEKKALQCFDKAITILITFNKKMTLSNLHHIKTHRMLLAKAKFFKGCIQGK